MAPSKLTPLLTLLTLSLLIHPTTPISDITLAAASEILTNAGYHSMSLTLPLISPSLSLPSLSSATLFAPPDTAFSPSPSSAGQPSLSLLQLHLCPRRYSPADLLSLPFASHLPTLLPNTSLSVTSSVSDSFVSLNGVKIAGPGPGTPLFDDGFFSIYPVESFFSPSFRAGTDSVSALSPSPGPTSGRPGARPECRVAAEGDGVYWEASAALRTRGYSLMAGFLDVQVIQFEGGDQDSNNSPSVITVFAPHDDALQGYFGNFSDYGSVFLRHVVGCEVNWGSLDDGVVLNTFLKGFVISVKRDFGGNLVFNGNISVDFPDFYRSERILVHGLSGILVNSEKSDQGANSPANDWILGSDQGEF